MQIILICTSLYIIHLITPKSNTQYLLSQYSKLSIHSAQNYRYLSFNLDYSWHNVHHLLKWSLIMNKRSLLDKRSPLKIERIYREIVDPLVVYWSWHWPSKQSTLGLNPTAMRIWYNSMAQLSQAVAGIEKICKLCDYIPKILYCPRIKLSTSLKFFNYVPLKKCDFQIFT